MSVNDGQSSTWGNPLRNVSQGGGVLVSFSGGDERSEPENAIGPVSQVDLHGRAEGAAAEAHGGAVRAAAALPCQYSDNCIGSGIGRFQSVPLSPYRKKSRHRLEMAIEWMVEKHGLERVGLLTLSFGVPGEWPRLVGNVPAPGASQGFGVCPGSLAFLPFQCGDEAL